MFRRMQKRFLDWPLAKKFVVVFSVMTVLSGALTVGALHLGLSALHLLQALLPFRLFLGRCRGGLCLQISAPNYLYIRQTQKYDEKQKNCRH